MNASRCDGEVDGGWAPEHAASVIAANAPINSRRFSIERLRFAALQALPCLPPSCKRSCEFNDGRSPFGILTLALGFRRFLCVWALRVPAVQEPYDELILPLASGDRQSHGLASGTIPPDDSDGCQRAALHRREHWGASTRSSILYATRAVDAGRDLAARLLGVGIGRILLGSWNVGHAAQR